MEKIIIAKFCRKCQDVLPPYKKDGTNYEKCPVCGSWLINIYGEKRKGGLKNG